MPSIKINIELTESKAPYRALHRELAHFNDPKNSYDLVGDISYGLAPADFLEIKARDKLFILPYQDLFVAVMEASEEPQEPEEPQESTPVCQACGAEAAIDDTCCGECGGIVL